MLKSVEFENFRALRAAKLTLEPFTLLLGANGSGKSTALLGISCFAGVRSLHPELCATWPVSREQIRTVGTEDTPRVITTSRYLDSSAIRWLRNAGTEGASSGPEWEKWIGRCRYFAFESAAIRLPVRVLPNPRLDANGENLASVLNHLSDFSPEDFLRYNDELRRWMPEFDRLIFDWRENETKAIMLRTRNGFKIPAEQISAGTLLALAHLALPYLPERPSLVMIEEPEHGLHPRLLRDVRDALYRLAYPKDYGEDREPIQVIATTHSPYFVDLFRDRTEEVVIAVKDGHEAHFERLVDRPDIKTIIGDMPLGDAWYSGVLGGVPDHT